MKVFKECLPCNPHEEEEAEDVHVRKVKVHEAKSATCHQNQVLKTTTKIPITLMIVGSNVISL